MSTFKIQCPSCSKTLETDEAWIKQDLPCPNCKASVKVLAPEPQLKAVESENPSVNATNPLEADQPLLQAVIQGNLCMVKSLIENGVQINEVDFHGNAPLHYAQKPDIVKILLEHGADVRLPGFQGATPLHSATSRKEFSLETVEMLISHGADVNAKDSRGNTPLHSVATSAAAHFLVSHGADLNIRNVFGSLPFNSIWRHAFEYGYDEFVQITNTLFNFGAVASDIDYEGQTVFHYFAYSLHSYSSDIANTEWVNLYSLLPNWNMLKYHFDAINAIDTQGYSPMDCVGDQKNKKKDFRLIFGDVAIPSWNYRSKKHMILLILLPILFVVLCLSAAAQLELLAVFCFGGLCIGLLGAIYLLVDYVIYRISLHRIREKARSISRT